MAKKSAKGTGTIRKKTVTRSRGYEYPHTRKPARNAARGRIELLLSSSGK